MISSFGNWASTLVKILLLLVLSILLPTFGISNSVLAAEQVYGSYSAIQLSIPVTSLEKYAQTGVIDDKLNIYQQYLPAEQFKELRQILLTPVKVSPVVVSQFLYTPQGEFILRRLAEAIKTRSPQPQPEFQTLRSAFISAAAEPGGLTLLNLLRKYPTSSINIDLAHSMGIAGELEQLINETSRAIAEVSKKSYLEATTQEPINFSQLPDLRQQGQFKAQNYTLKYFDLSRRRSLLTDLYVPNVQNAAPVIVISHGLGTDSSNFRYLANHLASYGFAVVVPNHADSEGQASEIAEADEFTDRPLDVKYILNELEKANQSDTRFKGQLNLQQVGVFGQSLGGYTALALAGAQINFAQLQKDCQPELLQDTWNMSLLLQCRALAVNKELGKELNLRDERVKAAIAVNPITSSIFGKAGLSQIQIPVMLVGSSDDTVAPALFEQILPFSWFANSQKYLVMLVGATHFSTIGNGSSGNEPVGALSQIIGDHPDLARRYINALSLPFFQTYVARTSQYSPYLNAAYAQAISSQPLRVSFVQSLTTTELAQVIDIEGKGTKLSLKKSPNSIVNFGFRMLDMGVALLHVVMFL
ncbi:MAG: alpha/beta hydrolase [Aulosira sp. ZfuVER01]|nr:alpha/beta hydrolase [Aulosira sp. ZfuVER01]MDZ7999584.1 alpha/beta hydrolase [Aulosira sp. DedVER01a]MDZ8054000.1 alpha/beta hydrolase [Aulosira sp. ZfuCHP01]